MCKIVHTVCKTVRWSIPRAPAETIYTRFEGSTLSVTWALVAFFLLKYFTIKKDYYDQLGKIYRVNPKFAS